MRTELRAGVRSTLPEARGRGVGSGGDTCDGEERKPVTGEARTGDADAEGRADDERSEADGMSGAMPPEAASRV